MTFHFIDREAFIQHNLEVVHILLMGPDSLQDLMIGIGVAFAALTIGIAKTHAIGTSEGGSLITGLFVSVIGVFALVEIYAATEILLIPHFEWELQAFEITVAVLIISFFLMIVPFTRMLFRAQYWTSVGAWLMGLICAALLIFCASFLYENPDSKRPDPTRALQDVKDRLDVQ